MSSQPMGTVKSVKDWASERYYPGTLRDVRFSTTPGMTVGAQNVNLMIFNDGIGYLARNGPVRVSLVLDSLFSTGELGRLRLKSIFAITALGQRQNMRAPVGTPGGLTAGPLIPTKISI